MEVWSALGLSREDEVADWRRPRIWYPALRAGYTRRGLVTEVFRRKARRIRCLIGLTGPREVARSSGRGMSGACRRSAR